MDPNQIIPTLTVLLFPVVLLGMLYVFGGPVKK